MFCDDDDFMMKIRLTMVIMASHIECTCSPLVAQEVLFYTTDHRSIVIIEIIVINVAISIAIIVNVGMVVVTTILFYNNIFQDFSSSGFTNWAFMTTHSWGESPIGKWQVSIVIEIAIAVAIVIIIVIIIFVIVVTIVVVIIVVTIVVVIIVTIPSLRSTTTHTATGVRRPNSSAGLWSSMAPSQTPTQRGPRIALGKKNNSNECVSDDDADIKFTESNLQWWWLLQ